MFEKTLIFSLLLIQVPVHADSAGYDLKKLVGNFYFTEGPSKGKVVSISVGGEINGRPSAKITVFDLGSGDIVAADKGKSGGADIAVRIKDGNSDQYKICYFKVSRSTDMIFLDQVRGDACGVGGGLKVGAPPGPRPAPPAAPAPSGRTDDFGSEFGGARK